MHAMINHLCSFLTCSVCLLVMGSGCVWGLGEGSTFQLVRGLQNGVFTSQLCMKCTAEDYFALSTSVCIYVCIFACPHLSHAQ